MGSVQLQLNLLCCSCHPAVERCEQGQQRGCMRFQPPIRDPTQQELTDTGSQDLVRHSHALFALVATEAVQILQQHRQRCDDEVDAALFRGHSDAQVERAQQQIILHIFVGLREQPIQTAFATTANIISKDA